MTSALSSGEGDAEMLSSPPSELRSILRPEPGAGIWTRPLDTSGSNREAGVRMKMQSQSGTRKLEPNIGHCQVLV